MQAEEPGEDGGGELGGEVEEGGAAAGLGYRLAAERDARAAEASHAQRRIRELEDELTAAREGLRRVIRQASR